MFQQAITIQTSGRGVTEVTGQVQRAVAEAGLSTGLCHVFIHHTSASLMLCENADPSVLGDLERFFTRLVPDGDSLFRHVAEGPDDMSAHVRSVITTSGLTIPVTSGRCALGTWQGVFLWEHRAHAHRRRLTISVW